MCKPMNIYEARLDDALLETLVALSADWEAENSTYGYRKNERSDIEPNRIFLAEEDGGILGYLFGHAARAERASSVMEAQTPYFEIKEIYVRPEHRGAGVGRALFRFAEQRAGEEGFDYVMLTTATKDYRKILHFYIDELGMDIWSARLFKKL